MICFLLLAFTFLQSKPNPDNYMSEKLIEIDVTRNYPKKEVYLQDIAKVEYIPLETNNKTLMREGLDLKVVHVSDNYIIASNHGDGDVFVFDGKGKSKFSFNHKGPNGAMEYLRIAAIAFDEKAKEIFIYDISNRKWYIYGDNGKFIRKIDNIPSSFFPRDVYNFDDETFLVYDDGGVSFQNNFSKKPYFFISKKSGLIVNSLNINLPVRVSNSHFLRKEENNRTQYGAITIPIVNNRSNGKNFLIADVSADTIYRLGSDKKLQPIITRKPSIQKANSKVILSNNVVTESFIILEKTVLDFDIIMRTGKEVPEKHLMCDFKTGQIVESKFINRDYKSWDFLLRESACSENTYVALLNVAKLVDENKSGKISGELKEHLKSLDYEDNPVLMKIKF